MFMKYIIVNILYSIVLTVLLLSLT